MFKIISLEFRFFCMYNVVFLYCVCLLFCHCFIQKSLFQSTVFLSGADKWYGRVSKGGLNSTWKLNKSHPSSLEVSWISWIFRLKPRSSAFHHYYIRILLIGLDKTGITFHSMMEMPQKNSTKSQNSPILSYPECKNWRTYASNGTVFTLPTLISLNIILFLPCDKGMRATKQKEENYSWMKICM